MTNYSARVVNVEDGSMGWEERRTPVRAVIGTQAIAHRQFLAVSVHRFGNKPDFFNPVYRYIGYRVESAVNAVLDGPQTCRHERPTPSRPVLVLPANTFGHFR